MLNEPEILAQALPYIEKYKGKTLVIKYGGNAMVSEELRKSVLNDLILLQTMGIFVVLVHGGGPEISGLLKAKGMESYFVDGLRYTDEETMEVVKQALCDKLNKELVDTMNRMGGNAVGIQGMDELLQATQLDPKYGLVGEVCHVNTAPVLEALEKGCIPVIATVAQGVDGNPLYNINGDTATAKLAVALGAEKVILLTDIAGLLRDPKDESTLIPALSVSEVPGLVAQGIISGGMIPKIGCCVEAIESGVESVVIADGRAPHASLNELFTHDGMGPILTREGEKKWILMILFREIKKT